MWKLFQFPASTLGRMCATPLVSCLKLPLVVLIVCLSFLLIISVVVSRPLVSSSPSPLVILIVCLSVVNHVHCRLSTVGALVSTGPLLSRHFILAPALAVPKLCPFGPSAARSSVVPRPSVRLFAHGYHCLVAAYLSRPWPSQNLCCSAPAVSMIVLRARPTALLPLHTSPGLGRHKSMLMQSFRSPFF